MYSKRCPKNSHSSFYLKEVVFKKPLESPYIWTNFKSNLDTMNFQNLPNLVTLLGRSNFLVAIVKIKYPKFRSNELQFCTSAFAESKMIQTGFVLMSLS